MKKDAIPTIFFSDEFNSNKTLKSFKLNYDSENQRYYHQDDGVEFQSHDNNTTNEEESVLTKKRVKCEELRNLCRFCFNPETNSSKKCVEIAKLNIYNIRVEEIYEIIGVQENEDIQSELICETCFLSVVEFDAFRKKCVDAQNDIWNELREFDVKFDEIKNRIVNDCRNVKNIEEVEASNLEVLEEHLEETQFIITYNNDSYDNNQIICQNDPIDKIQDNFQIIYHQQYSESMVDGLVTGPDESLDRCQAFNIEVVSEGAKIVSEEIPQMVHGVDEYTTTDEIIKNPERNRFSFKIYECFFCKLKFAGRKTYIAHKCKVSEVQCDQCEKVFNRIQAYNSHVSHVHGSLPISKQYCPLCKTFIFATTNQFKQHRRSCNKELRNQPIECEICEKTCNSLKGYSIHKIFHDTRNFTTKTGEKIAKDGLNSSKRTTICELCGKNFQSTVGYRMHRRNVHRIGQTKDYFQCTVCSKSCPTKRSLFDHMRNTHRVQESPCTICGKVYRTKILLKKHMMYHDESKRTFKCKLCPEKSYFTNVALKRHEKSHLGSRDFSCEQCDVSYSTNHQLKNHKRSRHLTNLTKDLK